MRWLEKIEETVIALLLAAMTAVTFMQVVARYVFNYSFVWAVELTGVLFAWLIFIGMSYGLRAGAHIGVDSLVKAVGPRTARAMGVAASLLCLAYAVIVAVGGYQYVSKIHDVGILMQDLPMAQWIPRVILPIGFTILGLRFLQVLWRLVNGQSASLLGDEARDALEQHQPDEQGRGP
jgi:C4-dicarboxylate transporter DctQ subunit